MNTRSCLTISMLMLLAAALPCLAQDAPAAGAPQEPSTAPPAAEEQEPAPLSLELASAPAKPGNLVYFNAVYRNASGAPVAAIHETIDFPREKIVFDQARMGLIGDIARATMAVVMKDRTGAVVTDRTAADRLEIAVDGKQPFEGGVLVQLDFRVVTKQSERFRLKHVAQAFDVQGKEIPGLVFSDPHVVVAADTGPLPPAVFGCFFYMH